MSHTEPRYRVIESDQEVTILDTLLDWPVISYPYEDTAELFHQTMNASRECARLNEAQP